MTIAPYQDGTATNDHSYYGLGCNNGWGTSGEDGSQTPCPDSNAGGRYVTTADGETQKNGTYYNFQATTVGTGGTMSTKNADAPDAFCPLGWQLPYSGTGGDYYDRSKSWTNLFNIYSLAYQDGTAADATKVRSYPFSYVLSGYFSWYKGRLYNQTGGGNSWSQTLSGGNPHDFKVYQYGLKPVNASDKNSGFDIRCV